MATPTLVWHVTSSSNPDNLTGGTGDNYKIPMPNPVGAHNCLVLGILYPHGDTPTVTDNNGNSWPGTPTKSADAGVGNYVAAIFVLPNANAGQTTITVSFGTAMKPFQYTLSEYYNVDTVSPVNASVSSAGVLGSSLTTGSFTPGDGNLVWAYFVISQTAGTTPSNWVPGGGFTLLDGDIAWASFAGVPHASMYIIQSGAGAINPGITATGDTTDRFNCVAVALKSASAGTPPAAGIHINKILHFEIFSAGATNTLVTPATGNLWVWNTADNSSAEVNITSITDSSGGSWIKVQPVSDQSQLFYSINRTPTLNLIITVHATVVGPGSIANKFYDISGADPNPFDVAAGASERDVTGQTSVSDNPIITPTTANGLTIAVGRLFTGPGLAVTSPSGAVFDNIGYTGEIDADTFENADLQGHLYHTNTNTQHWNWTLTNTSPTTNKTSAVAAAFKAAPVAPNTSGTPFGIIGLSSSEW